VIVSSAAMTVKDSTELNMTYNVYEKGYGVHKRHGECGRARGSHQRSAAP
jgi:hypothetical protein